MVLAFPTFTIIQCHIIPFYPFGETFFLLAIESHFFFDYFHPTAKPHHEVGKEIYELIKGDEYELISAKQEGILL
jgi:hypothetical protein